ncbi:FAD-dependent oxidoreductase [Pseudaminobacter soli (ex Li et al. 2025)]|uniref:FAD-dependent oxidoreductase n=1 Tax=Pseudaminobacter soli (ex Li et al. 2025) TaxID=1295366 RepID=UPI001FDF9814|nr:FAD-dependent monooxygenase [Mesorhizobium soli]
MAQQQTDAKILIVGAGPTGLTAAVELARRGIIPRIIDRKEAPTPLSKAVGISPHSLDLLEPSGVSERLLAAGLRIRHVHFSTEDRELGVVYISALSHRFNFLLSLPQRDTEAIMVGRLAELGVEVEWQSSLAGLEENADGVEVTIATPNGEEKARFDWVYGADGIDSAVRKSLAIEFQGYTHKRQWSIADAEISDWPYEPLSGQAFLHRNGDLGFIIPIEEGRFRAVSNTDDALRRIPGNYRVTEVLRTDRFHIPARQAKRYQTNRVFLGGDAAHAHSPVGARGMNLGIEDATSFARRFFDGTLAGYTGERWPIGRRWIVLSERILRTAQATSPTAQAFRNFAFSIIGRFPALQRPFVERIAGLKE